MLAPRPHSVPTLDPCPRKRLLVQVPDGHEPVHDRPYEAGCVPKRDEPLSRLAHRPWPHGEKGRGRFHHDFGIGDSAAPLLAFGSVARTAAAWGVGSDDSYLTHEKCARIVASLPPSIRLAG